MAQGTKYAELPGLDTAPDTYTFETQSAASSSRSSSPTSEDEDEDTTSITRTHLQPRTARSRFTSSRISTKTTDFSDRISTSQDRGYAVSRTRRRRRGRVEEFTNGAFSDEEDDGADEETYAEKLARVRREVEELRLAKPEEKKEEEDNVVEELAQAVRRLDERIYSSSRIESQDVQDTADPQQSPSQQVQQNSDASAPVDANTLAQLTTLESRLAHLEASLGVHDFPSHPVAPTSSNAPSNTRRPLLPTLALLDRRITALSETSASSLEDLDAQIRSVTTSAQALVEIRRKEREDSVKAARELEMRPGSGRMRDRDRGFASLNGYSNSHAAVNGHSRAVSGDRHGVNSSTAATSTTVHSRKLDELFDLLPTVETLSPLVPAMLDRLKSLRGLHVAASSAAGDLKDVVSRQEDLDRELEKWRAAVERVEELVKDGRGKGEANVQILKDWVDGLEKRIGKLASD